MYIYFVHYCTDGKFVLNSVNIMLTPSFYMAVSSIGTVPGTSYVSFLQLGKFAHHSTVAGNSIIIKPRASKMQACGT
jgi:hypothetical protein